jgi:hypothetical protein
MQVLPIERMEPKRYYTVKYGERVTTALGPTVQMIVEDLGKQYQIYLPHRYGQVVKDEDIVMINCGKVWYSIMYRGFCDHRRLPLLEI